jgi:hypothetical protein
VHFLHLSQIQPLSLDGQIDGLTAGHSKGAAGFGQQLNESQASCRGTRQGRIPGQHVEGQRLQGIAHQNTRCLVIRLVNRWPTATKVVIVHGWQIVVYE